MNLKRIILITVLTVQAVQVLGQNLVGTNLRLKPSTLPTTCNTGDLRTDISDSITKSCITNAWYGVLLNSNLSSEFDAGATYGFKAPYFKTATSSPSTAGVLRLAASDSIGFRNNADDGNLLLAINGSNELTFNSVIIPTVTAANFQDSTFTLYDESDATKLLAFQLSGITTGNTRTLTIPDESTTIVGTAATQTLTNKTIDANSNTVSNIADAEIKSSAAIDATKIANGTVTSTEFQYIGGLTSDAQTQLDAKIAKSTASAKGDLIAATASATVTALNVGADGQVLTADSAQSTGMAWATPASAPSSANEYSNCSISASVGSNALTIALKDSSGSDPSALSACKIGFRSTTASTGTYSQVAVTAATSVTVSSGSTLGTTDAAAAMLYIYAINNSGTVELGVINGLLLDESSTQSSTTEGGAGAADTIGTLYSTTGRTSKAVRLIGSVLITEATAGTWASNATTVYSSPNTPKKNISIQTFTSGSSTYTTPAGVKWIKVRMVGGGGSGGGGGQNGTAGSGSAGNATTFGSFTAGGGSGGGAGGTGGGAGGTNTFSGTGISISGQAGGGGIYMGDLNQRASPGTGGATVFGASGTGNYNSAGGDAQTNSGGGGAGGGNEYASGLGITGSGGGSGGYIEAYITNPSASYSYAVGAAQSTVGSAGTGGYAGGAGAAGLIIVEEYY